MTSIPDRLSKHMATMAAGDISDSTTHRLMILLRQLLEERNEKQRYPTTLMFCDWSVHTHLDRSKAASALLDMLDRTWTADADADGIVRDITAHLSLLKLREEIAQLLARSFVDPSMIFDYRKVVLIMDCLLAELSGKPITRRPQDIEGHRAARLAQGHRFISVRLFFSRNEDKKNTPAKYLLNLVSKQIEPRPGGEVNIVMVWPIAVDPAGNILL